MKALDSGEEEEEEAVHAKPAVGCFKRIYLSLQEGAIMTDKYSYKMACSGCRHQTTRSFDGCARKAAEKSEKKRSAAQAPVPAILGKMCGPRVSGLFGCLPQVSIMRA